MELDPRKLVDLLTCAAGNDPAKRNLNFDARPDCWERRILHEVLPMRQWGIQRFLLHCPGGVAAGKPYELDMLVLAREMGLDWLLKNFVSSWRGFIQREKGVEVICYLGTIPEDSKFNSSTPDQWMQRALDSVRLPLEAGMSLGFDACIGFPINHPMHRFVQLLASMGTRVYVEGFPVQAQSHWAEFNVVAGLVNFHQAKAHGWGVPYDKVKGEIVRLVNDPPEGHTFAESGWELDYYSGLLAQGWSLCAGWSRLRNQRLSMRHLVEALAKFPEPGQ